MFDILLLLVLPLTVHAAVVQITFNETLKGYSAPGGKVNDTIRDFQIAYEQGKAANDTISFSLFVNIANVGVWKNDSLHNAVCTGNVVESSVTNGAAVPVSPGGSLHVFVSW